MTLVEARSADDEAFRTLIKHLEHIGSLSRHDRETCRGPLVVHLANLAECHSSLACGLHFRWHPRAIWRRCWETSEQLLICCDDCDHPHKPPPSPAGAGS